jgi:hypothetical protein
LDKKRNEKGQILQRGFRMDEKKVALRSVETSGSLKNYSVGLAMATARQEPDLKFFNKLITAAKSTKRPPVIDYERISIVARFLIDNWCGATGEHDMWIKALKNEKVGDWCGNEGAFVWKKYHPVFFPPPLCFFENCALARFSALALGKKQSDQDTSGPAVRKWISRLQLERANEPKIRQVEATADGIYFV